MAGGPIFPSSAYPVNSGLVFQRIHAGAGSNSKQDVGLGVCDATTLNADATWRLRFFMPPSLPTGTCTLWIMSLANATTGALKVNPKWASVAASEDPSSATLNAEGTSTITWSSGEDDVYKQTKITLDADTVVAGEVIVMDLVFEDSGTTLAVASTHIACVIWE
jgi:hypothetical protein